jgi:DDE family transposase
MVMPTGNVQDRTAFPALLGLAERIAPTVSHVWGDKGYTGQAVTGAAAKAGVTVDIVSGPGADHGFHRQARPPGRRTHQRLDEPLPLHRLPLRQHPHSA